MRTDAQQAVKVWIEKSIDKLIELLQNDILKQKIQILVIQPFLQYSIELIFPYIILLCAVIAIMILLMISIIVLIIYRAPPVIHQAMPLLVHGT